MTESIVSILERKSEILLEPMGVGDVLKELINKNNVEHYLKLLGYSKSDIYDIMNNKYNYDLREFINFSKITKKPVFYFEKIHETYLRGF